MMKKLQEAKAQMDEIKRRLDTITVEGKAPSGKISVTCTGNRAIKGIKIVDEALLSDTEMLEDHLILAVNDALQKAEQVNEAEMRTAAGSMMPGLGGLFK